MVKSKGVKESQVVIAVDFHKPGANNILPEDILESDSIKELSERIYLKLNKT